MAAELEKLGREIEARGYKVGGRIIRTLSTMLRRQNLIPETISKDAPYPALSPEDLNLDAPGTTAFLVRHGASTRIVNAMARKGMTVCQLSTASDDELLHIKKVGKKGLEQIRRIFPKPAAPDTER